MIIINKKQLSIGIAALFTANSAFAQLEEVLVTAQKREQSLQEVPISISTWPLRIATTSVRAASWSSAAAGMPASRLVSASNARMSKRGSSRTEV